MRAEPAARAQNQNPNHIQCCRQDSWCQAVTQIQKQTFHMPCTVPQTQTSSTEMPTNTGDLARGDQPGLRWVSPLPRSKGSCGSSSEAGLTLELPCINLPSVQRSTGRRGSTALWVSRASHQCCQGTQTPRHAQSLLQMPSGRGSQEQSGSQCSLCRTWLFPIPRHLQIPSSWSCFQHSSDIIQLKAFSGLSQHSSCAPPFTGLPLLPSQSPHQALELQLLSYLCEAECSCPHCLVLHEAALCLHHLLYREIRNSEQTQPKGLFGEEQALRRWSVVKASWSWGVCMLGITSAQLQCHPGTLTGHVRAHPSQGRFSSSSASHSPEQIRAQQSISWPGWAGMDGVISGAGRAFPPRSPVLSLLTLPHSSEL